MVTEQHLLDLLCMKMGCIYLSDLCFLSEEQRRNLAVNVKTLAPDEGDIREWNDALEYLTGAPPENSARAAKERLIHLVSQPDGSGGTKTANNM